MWIKQRKGQFVKDMDQSVTHLLCTDEQYKARKKIKRSGFNSASTGYFLSKYAVSRPIVKQTLILTLSQQLKRPSKKVVASALCITTGSNSRATVTRSFRRRSTTSTTYLQRRELSEESNSPKPGLRETWQSVSIGSIQVGYLQRGRSNEDTAASTWLTDASDLYRVFADVCPFEYQVELFRIFTDNFGTCEEKYVLYVSPNSLPN